ncbi:MAG: glycogen synthase [Fidelibacterota bacterium]
MQIVFVSAEVYPFSKVGGLGDVAGALPVELASLGVDMTVITPAYGTINRRKFKLESSPYRFNVDIGNETIACGLSRWQPPQNSHFQIFFIENEFYFGSRGVYADQNGHYYSDSAQRFLLFSKAGLEAARLLNLQPAVFHCNDNHCALIPVYLKAKSREYRDFQETKTLLTLHNVGYQGITEMSARRIYNLPDELFYPTAPLEWFGQINPLKAGILYADAISTVSPTHAIEIVTDDTMSAGLKNVLLATGKPVHGILNGVNYSEWNPTTDRYITQPYSLQTIAEKYHNKVALMNDVGISPEYVHKPLIGLVSRLVEQKGIPILIEALERILKMEIAIVILGSGEAKYEQSLRRIADHHSKQFKFNSGYNNPLSHKILAGCDIFLMPSRYEPCGITQMAALSYGTVPVIHKTGGLADTITQWNGETGNGFLFANYSADDLVIAVSDAVSVFSNPKTWRLLQQNGMQADFSWRQSAKQYLKLYKTLTHPAAV